MRHKITPSEVVGLMFYRDRDIKGYKVPEKWMKEGSIIHARLGYNQAQQFSRFHLYEGVDLKDGAYTEWWEITGMPDRVDQRKGLVYELKTYHLNTRKQTALLTGRMQLNVYLWLTGFEKGEVVLYNSSVHKITQRVKVDFDLEFFNFCISQTISLKKKIAEFVSEYQKEQRKVQDALVKPKES